MSSFEGFWVVTETPAERELDPDNLRACRAALSKAIRAQGAEQTVSGNGRVRSLWVGRGYGPSHPRAKRPRLALIAALLAIPLSGGSALAIADRGPSDWFSVLTSPLGGANESGSSAAILGRMGLEPGETRVLGRNLGRFNSTLRVSTVEGSKTVCYELSGERHSDPAMSYCWTPMSPDFPREWSHDHFNLVAPYSSRNDEFGVQLFGVAFDDVVRIRVQVDGTWRSIPLSNNGFYIDLRSVRYEQIGLVEATLADGSKQFHDIEKGM